MIMHKVIVKDECENVRNVYDFEWMGKPVQLPEQEVATFENFLEMYHQIHK